MGGGEGAQASVMKRYDGVSKTSKNSMTDGALIEAAETIIYNQCATGFFNATTIIIKKYVHQNNKYEYIQLLLVNQPIAIFIKFTMIYTGVGTW